jgi:hypothetical protein
MTDILDALAVYTITDLLRVSDSVFITEFDLSEDLADGIAATVAVELADRLHLRDGRVLLMKIPEVLAVETDLVGVWYFWKEEND